MAKLINGGRSSSSSSSSSLISVAFIYCERDVDLDDDDDSDDGTDNDADIDGVDDDDNVGIDDVDDDSISNAIVCTASFTFALSGDNSSLMKYRYDNINTQRNDSDENQFKHSNYHTQ